MQTTNQTQHGNATANLLFGLAGVVLTAAGVGMSFSVVLLPLGLPAFVLGMLMLTWSCYGGSTTRTSSNSGKNPSQA